MARAKPLSGVTILDFTQLLAGPSAAMMLGDLGADVIKVEQLSGDISRSLGSNRATTSPIFLAYNRNKRSIAVDFKTHEGKKIIEELVSRSDVVIEGFRPGVMDRRGLGYSDLVKLRPQLVYASLSGFGNTGQDLERAGVDAVVQAASGMMAINGETDGPPVKIGFQIVDAAAGLVVSQGVLACLMMKNATGEPQFFETSLYDVAIFMQSPAFVQASMTESELPRAGNTAAGAGYPTDLFVTADGEYIQVAAYFPHQWKLFCAALDIGEFEQDSRFVDNAARVKNVEALREIIQKAMRARTREQWMQRFLEDGIIASEVRRHGEVLELDSQRGGKSFYKVSPRDTSQQPYSAVSPLIRFGAVEDVSPAPELGEHTSTILEELGYSRAEVEELKTAGVVSGQ
jgi:crotonobetainyl-CoA:carnitine CoA-transferase CaiB-like acyl-CoA transferase